jgi:hypothetical protein
MRSDREILENAVRVVSEQAAKAGQLVDEALDAGLDGSHPLTVHAKMLRLELLNVKADLERVQACPTPSRVQARISHAARRAASPPRRRGRRGVRVVCV